MADVKLLVVLVGMLSHCYVSALICEGCSCSSTQCQVSYCKEHLEPNYKYRLADKGCCKNDIRSTNGPFQYCCFDYGGSSVPTADAPCYCFERSGCFANSTTTSATTPTTAPTTSTTTPKTTHMTTSSTTTIASTTPITTTPTSTTETTTETFVSLCDAPQGIASRILNGRPVENKCAYKGIAKLTSKRTSKAFCHAVYTTIIVAGKQETAFVTSNFCNKLIDTYQQNGMKLEVEFGDKTYPLSKDLFELKNGSGETSFLTPKEGYGALFSDCGKCQEGACSYDFSNPLMPPMDELTDCKVASYGVIDARTSATGGLNEVDVDFSPGSCSNLGAGNLCLKATSGLRAICRGDYGAPLYCRYPVNKELIFIGNVKHKNCHDNSPAFEVIPISK